MTKIIYRLVGVVFLALGLYLGSFAYELRQDFLALEADGYRTEGRVIGHYQREYGFMRIATNTHRSLHTQTKMPISDDIKGRLLPPNRPRRSTLKSI